jgi:hypothetical protein
MQNYYHKLILTLLFIFLFTTASFAIFFEPSFIGANSQILGMGKFDVAYPFGTGSFVGNPANIAYHEKGGISSMYGNLLQDANFSILNIVLPAPALKLGVSICQIATGNIYFTEKNPSGDVVVSSIEEYANQQILISLSRSFSNLLAWGISLKYFNKSIADSNCYGGDIDIGFLMRLTPKCIFGVNFQNILPMEFSKLKWNNDSQEDISQKVKAGVYLRISPRTEIGLGVDFPDGMGQIYRMGIQTKPNENLSLRLGAESTYYNVNWTIGAGVELQGINFDYTYFIDTLSTSNSSHFFSIGYTFPFRSIELKPVFPAKIQGDGIETSEY